MTADINKQTSSRAPIENLKRWVLVINIAFVVSLLLSSYFYTLEAMITFGFLLPTLLNFALFPISVLCFVASIILNRMYIMRVLSYTKLRSIIGASIVIGNLILNCIIFYTIANLF